MSVWLYVCDGDVICVDHDLNRCSGWWYVCSVNVVVLVKGRHLVERQFLIDVMRMCDLYMLCKPCVP